MKIIICKAIENDFFDHYIYPIATVAFYFDNNLLCLSIK